MLLQTGCYQVGSDGRKPTLVTVTRKIACRSRTSSPPPSLPGPSGAATWRRPPTLRCDVCGSDLCSCGQRSPRNAFVLTLEGGLSQKTPCHTYPMCVTYPLLWRAPKCAPTQGAQGYVPPKTSQADSQSSRKVMATHPVLEVENVLQNL